MSKLLTRVLFGKPISGEKLPQPTFRVLLPINRPTETEWVKQFKFGSRYGHRGSFYENNFRVTVA